jgi:hypothetical protein
MSHRVVEPELLDALPGDDPRAIQSRRDLRRLNWWMQNEKHLLAAIKTLKQPPASIVEAGSGDGTFMLSLARRLEWKHPVKLTLLDMQPVISTATLTAFGELGWNATVRAEKIQDWLASREGADLALANLFWHHFEDQELRECFARIGLTCRAFITCEPRRWFPAQLSTRLLWAISCNGVTRHDARVSVNAGFREQELSALWPQGSGMSLQEYPAGWTSQVFVAEREI